MKRLPVPRSRRSAPTASKLVKPPAALLVAPSKLVGDVRRLIEAARRRAAATVNTELTLLYWRIGERIRTFVLRDARAAYGEQVIIALARKLHREYGRGSRRNRSVAWSSSRRCSPTKRLSQRCRDN